MQPHKGYALVYHAPKALPGDVPLYVLQMKSASTLVTQRSYNMAQQQYLPGLTMPVGRALSDLATGADDREIENAYIEVS